MSERKRLGTFRILDKTAEGRATTKKINNCATSGA